MGDDGAELGVYFDGWGVGDVVGDVLQDGAEGGDGCADGCNGKGLGHRTRGAWLHRAGHGGDECRRGW